MWVSLSPPPQTFSDKDDHFPAPGKKHIWTFRLCFLGTLSPKRRTLIYSQQFWQVTLGRKGLLFQLELLSKFRELAHLSLFRASGRWRTVWAFSIPLNAYRWLPYSGASAGYLISLISGDFPCCVLKRLSLSGLYFVSALLLLSSFGEKSTDVSGGYPMRWAKPVNNLKTEMVIFKKGNKKINKSVKSPAESQL